MKYRAEINVMPLKAILDPQGKTVAASLPNIGVVGVENVRIGKHIHLEIEAETEEKAHAQVTEACKKLLANPIMESFEFELFSAE